MSDAERPDGNGDGYELDAIPEPVFDAIAALERAAATHDAEAIGRAIRALVDHYGVDADLPVVFEPYEIEANDPAVYERRKITAEHETTRVDSPLGGLSIEEETGVDLPVEIGTGVDHGDVSLRAEANGRDPDRDYYGVTSVRLGPDAAREVAVGLLEAADEAEQRRALEGADGE